MILEKLLGDTIPPKDFVDRYYLKIPYSVPKRVSEFIPLGSWKTVEEIFGRTDPPDLMVSKEGKRWEGDLPIPFSRALSLYEEGYTITIRHAEQAHPELKKLGDAFYDAFRGEINLHLYCTPGNEFGFGWHYDSEDVFILQTEGVKEYSLRKNTVNPWPLRGAVPRDMKYERESSPEMRCTLSAGDWLYVPNGWWHMGKAKEPAVSIAVGIYSVAAIDVFDFLRPHLLASFLWRQRLPVPGSAATLSPEELKTRYREIFSELGGDLSRILADERFLKAFLERKEAAIPRKDQSV